MSVWNPYIVKDINLIEYLLVMEGLLDTIEEKNLKKLDQEETNVEEDAKQELIAQ